MQYTQATIERIRMTRSDKQQEEEGRALAQLWIQKIATYELIESIAAKFLVPAAVQNWIVFNHPEPRYPKLYTGFAEEVRRFWGQYKDVL